LQVFVKYMNYPNLYLVMMYLDTDILSVRCYIKDKILPSCHIVKLL